MNAVHNKDADLALIPVENSEAGRVTDVHFLLPKSDLYIIGEAFLSVHHQLLGLKGTNINDIKEVFSHAQALAQCRVFLEKNKITPIQYIDTAASCEKILKNQDKSQAAIASKLAAELYNLEVIAEDIETAANNTTRFLIMAPTPQIPEPEEGKKYITSILFKARNIPAALYKALGGFATNAINITKLESYLENGRFVSASFYLEAEAHPEQQAWKNALEELKFFASDIHILGTYAANPFRYK